MQSRTWLCIGCGHRKVRRHATYCPRCRAKRALGWETFDQDDLPTKKEAYRYIQVDLTPMVFRWKMAVSTRKLPHAVLDDWEVELEKSLETQGAGWADRE